MLTYEHVRRLGLDKKSNVFEVEPRLATTAELAAAHDPDYVEIVERIDAGDIPALAGLGVGLGTLDTPIFEGIHTAAAAVCGASLGAVELLISGEAEHTFSPPGGLHHARRAEASGFCVYNDAACAIAAALRDHPEWRVVYVDVDVHHGDGTQEIFYENPRVLTISIHQSGYSLYPGTGFVDELGEGRAVGSSINLPLPKQTGEEDFLWALEELLATCGPAFQPDLLVTQLGADTHHGDPLAEPSLTMPAYPRLARLLYDFAHEHAAGRWLATGGGGYQADTVVPRVWTMYFAEMAGRPETVPAEWLEDRYPAQVALDRRGQIESALAYVLDHAAPKLEVLASQQ